MRKLFSLILCLVITAQAFANGNIQGTVTDSTTAETLIGVTVSLFKEGADIPLLSAITDVDGHYVFEAEAGTYEIEVKYMGFQTQRVTEIVVVNGKNTKMDITMSDKASTDLEEVVIQSSMKKESVSALYTMQKNAVAVSDGISADVIRKSPDRSTGDVLKRISGTTIVDNKFVVIRGMSDRYNTAMVDGAPLPSTEPNRKAFSFDIIPANMIDNIIITKAATPDLPGDFAGGAINILTKEVPEENFNNFSIGTGINTASTFKKFQSGYRSPTDFLGFDNGKRQLSPYFPTSQSLQTLSTYPDPGKGSIPYINALNNDYGVREHSALPQINLQGSVGRLYNLKGNSRFGVTAAVTYNHSENIKPNLLRQYGDYNYTDNNYVYSTNLGGLLNLGYYVGKSKFNLKTLYNRNFDDNFLYREGTNNSNSSDIRYYAYDLIQKSLFKASLDGTHSIGKKDAKIDWLVSYNYINNNQPDQRKVAYSYDDISQQYIAQLSSIGKSNNRLFSDMNESVVNAALNYIQPVSLFKKTSIKIGAFGQYRTRSFNNRYLGLQMNESKLGAADIEARPIGTLFGQDAIDQGYYTLLDQSGNADAYDATAKTMGGYAMIDNKFTDKFRAVWGARLESYNIVVNSVDKTEADQTWTDILPSVNLTYSLSDQANLRASYFRSLARPELRELTNLGYYDYELSANILGNPALQRTHINNFDLRYEWYMEKGGVLSASVFYKNFDQQIENKVYAFSIYEIKPENFQKAYDAGLEFEIRKNLAFIAPKSFLKDVTFYTNVAIIQSKVTYDTISVVANKLVTDRPMAGQAPYSINSGLSYAALNGKLNFNLLYNRIGQRLYLVGGNALGHVYERSRNLMDLQISYNVTKRSEFRLNMKDLFNNPIVFYFDQDNDKKFSGAGLTADGNIDPTKDMIYQQYKPGRTISLTYALKF
ncbi:TonB-dependent receptor plug domain-containing protein [Taibaiella lutea]|uniref:TonB-dependent receptor plug domain-containing protein n=1 Tax=Taibaiella lutea TaxID=2608001 RepID=A0A5M6CQ14_9BACT|nr:TonB-dependent receptor [Taibaiella lutea]KAA5537361.1 TonB-dependent receptor plug domain-containing protein [Taibaiella lutea]